MDESNLNDRISKQPVWVQNHISDLNSRISSLSKSLAEAEAALTAGPEDSDVFAETSDVSRPLGKGTEITFGTGGDTYTVAFQDGSLSVDASKDVSIEPQSSYEVVLRWR